MKLENPRIKSQNIDLVGLQEIVRADAKQRYSLLFEPAAEQSVQGVWWIRANQGHSIAVSYFYTFHRPALNIVVVRPWMSK